MRKIIFSSVIFLLFQGFVFAQDDCDDCPNPAPEDQVCVNTSFGAIPMPSECIALCLGFTEDDIVEFFCDFTFFNTCLTLSYESFILALDWNLI